MPILLFFLGVLSLSPSFAASGGDAYPSAPIDRADYASLQRGAAAFVSYCSGCHSAKYVRYGRLIEDLKIPESLLKRTIMPPGSGLNDGIQSAMSQADAERWFNRAKPPDLSLSAKKRGVDWLYAYLRSFYRDPSRPSGWNNTVFDNVAMPHVLAPLQGERFWQEDKGFYDISSAALSSSAYDLLMADIVNFMDYMADPARPLRHRIGYMMLAILSVLLIFCYFLYREYWRDVH